MKPTMKNKPINLIELAYNLPKKCDIRIYTKFDEVLHKLSDDGSDFQFQNNKNQVLCIEIRNYKRKEIKNENDNKN